MHQGGQTCYRVVLGDGVGVAIPLGTFGELGFRHAAGTLQMTAPVLTALFLQSLPHQVGPHEWVTSPGGRLSRYTLDVPAGEVLRLQLAGTRIEVVRR